MSRSFGLQVLLGLLSVLGVRAVLAQVEACGPLDFSAYGPFDYRSATAEQRALVERNHFTSDVEQLHRSITGSLAGDVAYTLRVFPNHPRALSAMARLARKEKTWQPAGSMYTVSCWYERATRFQPDDAGIRTVIGVELLRDGEREAAIEHLNKAAKLDPGNMSVEYNLGLAYFRLKDYDQALAHAREAYRLGAPVPGLRNMLTNVGRWKD